MPPNDEPSVCGGYVQAVLAKTIESVKEATGIDIREIMKADTYDAKVKKVPSMFWKCCIFGDKGVPIL